MYVRYVIGLNDSNEELKEMYLDISKSDIKITHHSKLEDMYEQE